jgi:hypothetical protein
MQGLYTLESVLNMQTPTEKFLVKLEDNIYGIRFKGFKLRDCDTNQVYHSFETNDVYELDYFASNILTYEFPKKVLRAKTIGSNLKLVVGDQLVENLDLVERHYIDDKLVASYRFNFPIFMPNSENNVEFIYSVPSLSEETIKKIGMGQVVEAKSDTFIFVKGILVIHRRADYKYI